MIKTLHIQNFIFIKDITLEFQSGFTVLTGETGAGKSILLDALLFVLGARGQRSLISKDEKRATVSIITDTPDSINGILQMCDIPWAPSLTIRRSIDKDGTSRAFLNDLPVTITLLKELAPHLADIHGQFERFLTPKQVRIILDNYGRIQAPSILKSLYMCWRAAEKTHKELKEKCDNEAEEISYLTFAIDDVASLNPAKGEVETLQKKRQLLREKEKLHQICKNIHKTFNASPTIEELLLDGLRQLSALAQYTDKVAKTLMMMESAYDALSEAMSHMHENIQDLIGEEDTGIHNIESRIFSLNSLSRKYNVPINELHLLIGRLTEQKEGLENIQERLIRTQKILTDARRAYCKEANKVSTSRMHAAQKLTKEIEQILPELKLPNACIEIAQKSLPEKQWDAAGKDHVTFRVTFNKGTALAPLNEVASGGELSRFMLALKVVTNHIAQTIIFDEVDSGMGGAVADAVGSHLKALSQNVQVLAITHAPQVAAYANQHSVVAKSSLGDSVATSVIPLASTDARADEIARMLSGASVSAQALEAAKKLMENGKA